MALKKKKASGNPAWNATDHKLFKTMVETFELTRDLRDHISVSNHIVMQGVSHGVMQVCDPEGQRWVTLCPVEVYDKKKMSEKVFRVMRNIVMLTKVQGDMTSINYVHIRSAALGIMFVYSELTGLPDPIDVVFKDMVDEQAEEAWATKPANQNKLLRRKVNAEA